MHSKDEPSAKTYAEVEVAVGAKAGAEVEAEGETWTWMKTAEVRTGGRRALQVKQVTNLAVVLLQMLARDIFLGPVQIHPKARGTGHALEVSLQIV